MNMVVTKWIGCVGLVGAAMAASLSGCGGSKNTNDNTGGSAAAAGGNSSSGGSATGSASGGSIAASGGSIAASGGSIAASGGSIAASGGSITASGGSITASGGKSAGTGGTTAAPSTGYEVDADGAYVCRKGVPTEPNIAPGDNGSWGKATAVTGGTFTYQKSDAEKPTLDTATNPGGVNVTATVAVGAYTGWGLYFKDPDKCFNVSQYTGGIRMTIGGDLGGGQIFFQVQTNTNYPADTANNKGACIDPLQWNGGCANNTTSSLTIDATPTTIDIPWTDLAGGMPVATVDTTQLLGIQWQVTCSGSADCAVNVTISDVSFY